jgi:hypothetical protein
MAKQTGEIKIVGTIDGICFYKMDGLFYAKQKSSLDRKRFFTDKAFEGSRKSSAHLAQASPLAARLYHMLPQEKKGRDVYRSIVGKVKQMLKQEQTATAITEWFIIEYLKIVVEPVTQPTQALQKKKQSPIRSGLFTTVNKNQLKDHRTIKRRLIKHHRSGTMFTPANSIRLPTNSS